MDPNNQHQDIILVVDDDPEICLSIQSVLTQNGYHVLTASDAHEAIAAMEQHDVTLAVLDLNLPDIKGLELMTRIRERWPYTIIVVLTGHGSLDSALIALRQGAHDFLLKPASASDIENSVRTGLEKRHKVLRRKSLLNRIEASVRELTSTQLGTDADVSVQHPVPTTIATSIKTNKLLVDLQRHRVLLNGQDLNLTPTEFSTLLALVRNTGHVISYVELVETTHGFKCASQEAQTLIKTHISHLRQKIQQQTPHASPIINVRGIGYMWDQSSEG